MSMIFWITIIICVTAVTITSIICSAKVEETKYEAFTCTVNNGTTDNELKKMVENLKVVISKMKEN